MFRKVLDELINFILPNSCISCGVPIDPAEKFICLKCHQTLEKYRDTHPWRQEYIERGIISNSMSAFWFREGNTIQSLMHAMKYQKMKSVGKMLGGEIGKQILETDNISCDFIIPVPLHKAKYRDRTYNQSEYIAKGIHDIIGGEVIIDGVMRTRYTGTQTKLNKAERKINVSDAFRVNRKHLEKLTGKNIIVVDDVITTGATILECASVLRQSGAGNIRVCSAAYAELKIAD